MFKFSRKQQKFFKITILIVFNIIFLYTTWKLYKYSYTNLKYLFYKDFYYFNSIYSKITGGLFFKFFIKPTFCFWQQYSTSLCCFKCNNIFSAFLFYFYFYFILFLNYCVYLLKNNLFFENQLILISIIIVFLKKIQYNSELQFFVAFCCLFYFILFLFYFYFIFIFVAGILPPHFRYTRKARLLKKKDKKKFLEKMKIYYKKKLKLKFEINEDYSYYRPSTFIYSWQKREYARRIERKIWWTESHHWWNKYKKK